MINVANNVESLTRFKRNSAALIKRMKKTGRPILLTVKGKAEAVILDATAYQLVAAHLRAFEGVRRGLAQANIGLGRPFQQVFDDLQRT